MSEFAPYATEYEAIEAYEDMLNDCYGAINICGITYDAGRAFKEVDPIAFRCGFNDWLDEVQQDFEYEDAA